MPQITLFYHQHNGNLESLSFVRLVTKTGPQANVYYGAIYQACEGAGPRPAVCLLLRGLPAELHCALQADQTGIPDPSMHRPVAIGGQLDRLALTLKFTRQGLRALAYFLVDRGQELAAIHATHDQHLAAPISVKALAPKTGLKPKVYNGTIDPARV